MAKIYYLSQLLKQRGSEYSHFRLSVWEEACYHGPPELVLEWQTDPSHDHWYGFGMEIQRVNSLQDMRSINRMAGRILKSDNVYDSSWTPDIVLDRLEEIKAVEVVYDSRLHEYIPIDKVPDRSLLCWLDDFEQIDYREYSQVGCMVNVLASSEADAKVAVRDELYARGYMDYLAKYIQAGQPVRRTDDIAPEVVKSREKIAL